MGQVAELEQVAAAVSQAKGRGETVVLTNGAFDLLHVGHVRYLRGARAHGELLVVAVNSDASVRRAKGEGRPAMPAAERAEIVAALDGVDWVVVFEEDTVSQILARLQPQVHAKGTDYTTDSVPEAKVVEAYGGRVVIAGDPKDHSTTEILEKLKG